MATTVTTRRQWQERPFPRKRLVNGAQDKAGFRGNVARHRCQVPGSALGGLVASAWGVTAPFWFAFAGSAFILALIWRSLLHIARADEPTRASAPTEAA
jgi:hypothetical protein